MTVDTVSVNRSPMECPRCGRSHVAIEEEIHETHYRCPRNHHWVVEHDD